MAVNVDPQFPNLQNLMSRLRPDGSVETDMVNTMVDAKPMLEDIPFQEANQGTGHRITEVTGMPSPAWRMINKGTPATKGQTGQFVEGTGILEDWSIVDEVLADNSGNAAAYRNSEDKIKEEAFAQEAARALLYESVLTSPERIHGLSPRYTGKAGSKTEDYVLLLGSRDGVNCESIWLIDWDPEKVFGIYPKGSLAGLHRQDKGKQIIETQPGLRMNAYTTHFRWDLGLAIRDYRKIVRIQYDPDDAEFGPEKKSLYLALQRALNTIRNPTGNIRFYMSRNSKTLLDSQLAANSANFLEYIELGKRRVPAFMEAPIRIEDTLVPESAL